MQTFTIGITGGSGSGKSYLIKALRAAFSEGDLAILSQDNYYRLRADQETDQGGVKNFDLPSSFEMDDFVRDFKSLIRGELVTRTEYTYNQESLKPGTVIIKPAPVLLVEGLFILTPDEIRESLDLKIFVEASDVVKVKRRLIRDSAERNYPAEDVLYRYEHHVVPSYRKFIEPHKYEVDIILNNNRSIERGLELLTTYIRQKALTDLT